MNTKLNTILAFFLLTAGAFTSPAFADDTSIDKQPPAAREEQPETWPSSVKPEDPTPGICASFLDPDFRLAERNDDDGEKKDASKKEKADKDSKDKKETKQKKRRANAYTNPESTSCVV